MIKILAIDDKNDNLITISAMLRSLLDDCEVVTALSGIEGIEKAAEWMPDTIILDVKMPGMDGFETCKKLKANDATRHIPVILLTAIRTDIESRIYGLSIGADAFLTKPIDESELVAQINVMLRIKKAEDKLRQEKDLLESLVAERTRELSETVNRLRREKEFIRRLDDASPAYYVAVSPDGNILNMNRALLEILGQKIDEVLGRAFIEEFIPEADRETAQRILSSLIADDKKISFHESRLSSPSEIESIVEWHGSIMRNIDGSSGLIFFVGIDITERRRLEKIIMADSERQRRTIGQDLYDGPGQNLAALAFKSEILKLKMKERSVGDIPEIGEIGSLVIEAMNKIRELARDLTPIDNNSGGLTAAFEELCRQTGENYPVSCLLQTNSSIVIEGDLEAASLYYIIRDAVNFAVKHGHAGNILISSSYNSDELTVQVSCDGNLSQDDMDKISGIDLMRYRAWLIGATLDVRKNEGGGFSFICVCRSQPPQYPRDDSVEIISGRYLIDNEEKKSRVLIVDDHPVVRHGLMQIINREDDLTVCGEADNANEAVRLIAGLNPHLVITDISLSGASGLDLVKAVRSRFSGLPVLILSIHDESIFAARAIRAGASGYVMKQEAPRTVVKAVRLVLAGKQYLSDAVKEKILHSLSGVGIGGSGSPLDSLTDREYEIFQMIGTGMKNKVIADRIQISVKTVENYRDRIKNKLNIESASELSEFAVNWVHGNAK